MPSTKSRLVRAFGLQILKEWAESDNWPGAFARHILRGGEASEESIERFSEIVRKYADA